MPLAANDRSDVAGQLRDRFPTVDPEVIRVRVDAAFASLAAAPIQSFTPILVQRAVRGQLLALTRTR